MMQLALLFLAEIEFGGYISIWKTVLVVMVALVWAWMVAWIDKDAPAARLPREMVNTGVFIAGIVGFALFFFVHMGFFLSFLILLFFLGGGIGAYLIIRNSVVGLGDLQQSLGKGWRGVVGDKKKTESAPGAALILDKNGQPLPVPDGEDPNRGSYDAAQMVLTDPLRRNAERIEVRPAENCSAVQFVVDGMAFSALSLDRNAASGAIAYLKAAANLDVNDRRKPQKGTVRVVIDGRRRELEITTAGSTAGESMLLLSDPKKRHEFKLEDLGLLAEQLATMKSAMAQPGSIVIVTAPAQQGLTSMLYACLRTHDAFMQHLQTIERRPPIDLEGITQNALGPHAPPAEEFRVLEWVISQQPEAIMIDLVENPASAKALVDYVAGGKHVYVGMRAPSTFDALATWRKMVGDDPAGLRPVRAILSGRILRRLCQACKVGYAPDPEMLRKLGMDPARVQRLFQARTQPVRDAKGNPVACQFCQELRYKGRFGVYELLTPDDEMRKAVAAGASIQQLRPIFRKQRGRYLQEVAFMYVEQGETSVQEAIRVLRGDGAAQPGAAPAQTAGRA